MNDSVRTCLAALFVIGPLVAAAWLPAEFPGPLRRVLLGVWGIGATVAAERRLSGTTLTESLRSLGLVRPRPGLLARTLAASLPMWAFLPAVAWTRGLTPEIRSGWLSVLGGVVLVNGITEELIHRGFVFGRLRSERSFAFAATCSGGFLQRNTSI